MKKFMSLAVALVATVMLGSSAFAISFSTATYKGVADFTGAGSVAFSFTLKAVSNDGSPAVANQISWNSTAAFITGDDISWVRAQDYAVVAATVTKAGFNVYMYQTNKKSTNYKAETPRTNEDPVTHAKSTVYSGLVNKALKGGENKGYIPVAFSLVGTKNKNITYSQATSTTSATRSDKYFMDEADSTYVKEDYGNYMKYTKIAGLVGPVFGQGEYGDWTGSEVVNNTAYMYFFGGFSKVRGGDVYGTDQLHVIQVTE